MGQKRRKKKKPSKRVHPIRTQKQKPSVEAKATSASTVTYPPGQGFRALTERWTAERVECVVELLHTQEYDTLKNYLLQEVPQFPHPSDPEDLLDLKGFHFDQLNYRVDLGRVHFRKLNLWSCRLEDVNLKDAIFEDCSLGLSTFSKAYIRNVRFERCDLLGCSFDSSILDYACFKESPMRFVSWSNTKVDIQAFPDVLEEEKQERWSAARDMYKELRLNLHSMGDEAGASWAMYRQCRMDRKHLWQQKRYLAWSSSLLMDWLWGYGEKPVRLFFFSLAFCTLCAFGYFAFGVTYEGKCTPGFTMQEPLNYFYRCVYFSFVTFTTLGYGDLAPCAALSRFLASMEAFSGVFIMGLFVTANVRKLSGH